MSNVKAREGHWYSDRATREVFYVIAVDEEDGWIDVRDRFGDVDELDLSEWEMMDLELCGAPADWDLQSTEHGEDEEHGTDTHQPPRNQASARWTDSSHQRVGPSHHTRSSGTT